MYRVKIIGAGSIGNHLAYAARTLSWKVTLCDINQDALQRTRNEIYPSRYGKWDDEIQLCHVNEVSKETYDLVFVGTPPEYHIDLAIEAIENDTKGVLIEKPLCAPSLKRAQELCDLVKRKGTKVFVGYDHVVGKAAGKMRKVLSGIGDVETIDVEFREFWGGIFAAHFWLEGPWETYLGFWERGGGATGEHSHAANLFQHFASQVGAGRIVQVSAMSDYVKDSRIDYDKLCVMNVQCESGLIGRIVQDVVTTPPRKWARVQSQNGYAEWYCGIQSGQDLVSWKSWDGEVGEERVYKTRPDDFIAELQYINNHMQGKVQENYLSLEKGLDTMLVLAASYLSSQVNRSVMIDYSKGYTREALEIM